MASHASTVKLKPCGVILAPWVAQTIVELGKRYQLYVSERCVSTRARHWADEAYRAGMADLIVRLQAVGAIEVREVTD